MKFKEDENRKKLDYVFVRMMVIATLLFLVFRKIPIFGNVLVSVFISYFILLLIFYIRFRIVEKVKK